MILKIVVLNKLVFVELTYKKLNVVLQELYTMNLVHMTESASTVGKFLVTVIAFQLIILIVYSVMLHKMMFCFKTAQAYEVIFDPFDRPFECKRKERQQMLEQQITKYVERLSFYSLKYPYQWYNFFDFWLDDDDVQREHNANPTKNKS